MELSMFISWQKSVREPKDKKCIRREVHRSLDADVARRVTAESFCRVLRMVATNHGTAIDYAAFGFKGYPRPPCPKGSRK